MSCLDGIFLFIFPSFLYQNIFLALLLFQRLLKAALRPLTLPLPHSFIYFPVIIFLFSPPGSGFVPEYSNKVALQFPSISGAEPIRIRRCGSTQFLRNIFKNPA
jgi:hypothetical protein